MNRTKIPPKRKFIQSPKKGKTGEKSQRTPTPPDSPFEDEDYEAATQRQETLDNSEDPDYDPGRHKCPGNCGTKETKKK